MRHVEQVHPGMGSCHATLSESHRRHGTGNLAEVGIKVRVPGGRLTANEIQTDSRTHEHLEVAIRNGFAEMARKLKRCRNVGPGDTNVHGTPLKSRIDQIDHRREFGQILATDHRLIYFHKNSVADSSFDDLYEGNPVELVVQPKESDIGPQASTVRPIGSMRFKPG